jgi:hypothetical protein
MALDARRMILWINLSFWLMGGVVMGLGYFCALRRSAGVLTSGRRAGPLILAALVGARMAALGAALTFAALQGAGPLLAAALGLLIGRYVIMKGVL